MRTRLCVRCIPLLFLTILAAKAAMAATAAPAPSAPAAASFLCALGQSAAAAPTFTASGFTIPCGACSQSPCVGKNEGDRCVPTRPSSSVYSCQNAIGSTCSQDGNDICQCWTGPLP